ncbi:MAG: porin [Rickettsiales bacterium]|nr:MAG: porin [Rickettsiales bacterium]
MKNSKKLLLGTATALLSFSAGAMEMEKPSGTPVVSDLTVKISAFSHFQTGMRKQKNLTEKEKNVSAKRKTFAFNSESAMSLEVSNYVNDFKYGGKIVLVPTNKRKGGSFNGSHIFTETNYGRFEAGSPLPASYKMQVDGHDIAAAPATNWSRYVDFSTEDMMQKQSIEPSFAVVSDFFLDSKLATKLDNRNYSSEPARSISYYTPKFALGQSSKVQVGVSYAPDSSNTGAEKHTKVSSGLSIRNINKDGTDRFEIDSSVRDAVSAGITLEQNFSDGIDLKVGLTGEYANASGKATKFENDVEKESYKLSPLRTFNIGAILNVGSMSYAGSFGSLGKSLTTPEFHKTGRSTKYYTGTVAYKQGPFAASVSYFKSNQYENTVDAISIGTHYVMAPGFKPYVQISTFRLKGKPEFYPKLEKKKTRGTVALIGVKLSL